MWKEICVDNRTVTITFIHWLSYALLWGPSCREMLNSYGHCQCGSVHCRLVLKSSSCLFSLTTESITKVAAKLLAEAKYLWGWDEGSIDFLILLWFNRVFMLFSFLCSVPLWLAELLPLNRVKTSFLCLITQLQCIPFVFLLMDMLHLCMFFSQAIFQISHAGNKLHYLHM